MSSEFDEILHYDPLNEAEKITGKSYKDDEDTLSLGILLGVMNAEDKKDQLFLRDDSYMGISFAEMVTLVEESGFSEIHSYKFAYDEQINETYAVFWHTDGILLTLESYHATAVNNAKIFFNWERNKGNTFQLPASQHHVELGEDRNVFAGTQDVREGLKHKLETARANGTFLNPWVDQPFLWFFNYQQEKIYEIFGPNGRTKLAEEFPDYVKQAIGE